MRWCSNIETRTNGLGNKNLTQLVESCIKTQIVQHTLQSNETSNERNEEKEILHYLLFKSNSHLGADPVPHHIGFKMYHILAHADVCARFIFLIIMKIIEEAIVVIIVVIIIG